MSKYEVFNVPKNKFGENYDQILSEQYKLYVEMADRISARRMMAHSFFIGINTAIIGAGALLFKEGLRTTEIWMLTPFLMLLLLCFLWWRIINSYRQLNAGKYKVIGEIEQKLPIQPYHAEWKALGEGKNSKLYKPLTHVEDLVPALFGAFYIILAIIIFISS